MRFETGLRALLRYFWRISKTKVYLTGRQFAV